MFNSIVCFNIHDKKYYGWVMGYDPEGVDVEMHFYIAFKKDDVILETNNVVLLAKNNPTVPFPKSYDETTVVQTAKHILLKRVYLEWRTFELIPDMKDLFYDYFDRQQFVFRRVYTTHKTSDMGTFICEHDGDEEIKHECSQQDIDLIPKDYSKNNQNNEELKFLKRHILKKGKYYGFTTNRSLRTDAYLNKSIYFNNDAYQEFNVITGEWERPDHDVCNQLPYAGDLICGTVRIGDKGPYFDKWFICSEQFMKLVTVVLNSEHESVENNLSRLCYRLRTNKFMEWLYHNYDALDEVVKTRYHRFRYEKCASIINAYVYIAFLCILKEPEYVENLEEGADFVLKCAMNYQSHF